VASAPAAGIPWFGVRVALVVERFEPGGGGVENAVWQVARALVAAGDEVHVVARRGASAPEVRLHPVPVPTFWQPLRVLAFAARAGRAVEAGRYDVVHSFTRTLRQDVIHTGGGSHADFMRHTYGRTGALLRRGSPRHAVQLALERRMFADPKALVQCVSQMVKRELVARFGVDEARLFVVPNGVDPCRFHPERGAAERDALRASLGANGTTWLLAGSNWRRKGLDTALRALARTADRGAQLWVAGGDAPAPWRRLTARLGLAERVRFLGVRHDLERVYAAADGLLLPTRYDAFGLVCLEAAACARPVVTSTTAGAAELLGDAAVAVADPEDAAGFARALDRLSDPGLRQRLGAEGRRVAEAHTWQRCVEQLRALYARVRR
jgi:UDP-glucose:(heptosyl)LPS alpha-1,3-glucosyltransferase